MPQPGFIRHHNDGILLAIKLQPRASRNEIGEPIGDELKVKVTAPPVDSAANQALIQFLATSLDHPRHAITLVRGHTSRHKILFIQGLTPAAAAKKLIP